MTTSLRLTSRRRGGFLWHYGHFMHDLLVPLALLRRREVPRLETVYLADTPQQSPGIFGRFAEELIGVTVETLPERDFHARADVPLRPLQGLGFGPYAFRDLHDFLAEIEGRFKLLDVRSPRVLLVDRGREELGFPGHPAASTGAARRRIGNHEALAASLASRLGLAFRSVLLEGMAPIEQARLFYNAEVIVGEHGSGLSNLFFSRPGTRVIELNPIFSPTFRNIARAKPLRYEALGGFPEPVPRFDPQAAPLRAMVDIDEVYDRIRGARRASFAAGA